MRKTYLRCHCHQCSLGFHRYGHRTPKGKTYKKLANRMVRRLASREISRCHRAGDFDSFTNPVYSLGYTD